MCGVAAVFAYHYAAPAVDRGEVRQVRDYMEKRGPDSSGEWYSKNGRVGLGHRRLAIIDTSDKGAQPMASRDGSAIVSFNGEIYNYRELRRDLEKKGYVFRSNSDTEVLLNLYAEKKETMVHDLRGMFAFVLWDAKENAMLLARDPYGIKPLYYADDGWTVRVASQVKALLAGGRISHDPEPAGIVGFFLTGSVPEPFTVYQEIRAIPAGSVVWIDRLGPSEPKTYFSIARTFLESAAKSPQAEREKLQAVSREVLRDTIRYHFVADVPVGVFLSAGIDSGALVGLAHDAEIKDLQTVTLAFEEFRGKTDDEAPLAEEVARLYGTKHTTRMLSKEEFRRELPRVLEAMDQPTIDGVNTYFISKATAETGLRVALSGLGGDELFGGYPSFRDIPRWINNSWFPAHIPCFGHLMRMISAPFLPPHVSPKLAGMFVYGGTYPGAYFLRRGLFMPWELKYVLDEEIVSEGLRRLSILRRIKAAIRPDPKNPFARIAALEASLYMRNQLLRDADWAGMAHSLEIRVPLVDAALLKSLATALVFQQAPNGKKLLANAPSVPLPQRSKQRKKTGFSVPIDRWLEEDDAIDTWRKVPSLAKPGCHWARRWAYAIYNRGVT